MIKAFRIPVVGGLLFFFILSGVQAAGSLLPYDLSCEYWKNPLGIDVAVPRLSWKLSATARDQFQSAYEIQVSEKPGGWEEGQGLLWNSGKVKSANSILVPLQGITLRPFHRYFWRVRVYDLKDQPSDWTAAAWFETAMMQPSDWVAGWIGDGSHQPLKQEDYYQPNRMPIFRREFRVNRQIRSARLYISGLGYYEAYLNGKKIGDHVLDPGFTCYSRQVQYVVYDLDSLLKKGLNTVGVMLGNGWWNPLPFKFFGRWDLRDYQQTGRPCLKAEIHLQFRDGREELIPTDSIWKVAPGPIVRNNVYLGETYDARLEQKNWNIAGIDTLQWKPAQMVKGPSGRLTVQMQPAIKVRDILAPVSIIPRGKDTFMVDLGQNFAGGLRLRLKGQRGRKISVRYGEELFSDGSLNYMTTAATQIKEGGISGGPGAPPTAWQQDDFICKGGEREVFSTRFSFHGFRYLEITGWPGVPAREDIQGLRLCADLAPAGSFSCSNELFNRIHKAVQWTFLSNVFSVQSDCPGREKMGYGGDMVATADAFIFNYNMAQFYTKSVTDFSNDQRPLGGITEIAPFTGIADRGYGDNSGPMGWELAFPFLQKQLYDFYGDRRIIENNYEAFSKQLAFLESRARDHLFDWDISDHEALDPKPEAFSASAFYYHHVLLAAEFAGILGKTEDSLRYAKQALEIKASIIGKFQVPGTGRLDNGTQGAQVLALWYGLSSEAELSGEVLKSELKRKSSHLSTGIFSTKMFFDVMRQLDWAQEAYDVVNQKSFPGWGYMLQKGATTLWESWREPGTVYSCNHPMFGSVDEWFYRSLLGINPLTSGFESIRIKPQPAGDLRWARGSYQSPRGPISVEWEKKDGRFFGSISIPANCRASIFIPCVNGGTVLEGGKPISIKEYQPGYALIEMGSGDYHFESKFDN